MTFMGAQEKGTVFIVSTFAEESATILIVLISVSTFPNNILANRYLILA